MAAFAPETASDARVAVVVRMRPNAAGLQVGFAAFLEDTLRLSVAEYDEGHD